MKRYRFITAIILISTLLSACGSPLLAPMALPAVGQAAFSALYTPPANATPTPTPFQPLAPTPTYLPTLPTATPTVTPTSVPTEVPRTPFPNWRKPGYFPPPSGYSYLAVPPPVGRLKQPEGQINVLLLGSDHRFSYGNNFRTDTIILVTINPKKERISVTSFPRDLYVYIPGYATNRINTAYGQGGFEMLAKTIEYNFGVRPEYFILIDFRKFVSLIDKIGGLDVNVGTELTDLRGNQWVTFEKGVHHMNGQTALWYARSRKTTSDFERNRRQQEVLQAIFERIFTLENVLKAPKLYEENEDAVTTNIRLRDILPYIPLATRIDTSDIKHYYVNKGDVTNWITPEGAMVLLPNREAILETMRKALKSE
jgi:polyisoprenyl-teichoic acid--peptidoglycan teichoic acid transferase